MEKQKQANSPSVKKNITNIIFGLAISVLLFGGGFKLGELNGSGPRTIGSSFDLSNVNSDKAKKEKFDLDLFWQTEELLSKKYVDKKKLDPKKMFYGALKGDGCIGRGSLYLLFDS